MSVTMVLLPVFVQVTLTFALLFWVGLKRSRTLTSGETHVRDIALGEPNWPAHAMQVGNCFRNQFEVPVLFYVLIALLLPLRKADLLIVLLSWVFVVARLVHAWIFVTSNNVWRRGSSWLAAALALAVMWLYSALRVIFLI